MPGWGTTLPSTHTGAAPGETQRLQITPESIQGHWGHLPRLGAWGGCAQASGAVCPLPGPVGSPLPRAGHCPSPGHQAGASGSHVLDSRTFEQSSGLRAGRRREVPSQSAWLSQFRRPLRSEAKVPAGQGLEEESLGWGSPAGAGRHSPGEAEGRGTWGAGEVPAPRGAGAQSRRQAGSREAAGRADRAQVGALTWPLLTCRAERPGPGGKGGRKAGRARRRRRSRCCRRCRLPDSGESLPGLRDLPPPM